MYYIFLGLANGRYPANVTNSVEAPQTNKEQRPDLLRSPNHVCSRTVSNHVFSHICPFRTRHYPGQQESIGNKESKHGPALIEFLSASSSCQPPHLILSHHFPLLPHNVSPTRVQGRKTLIPTLLTHQLQSLRPHRLSHRDCIPPSPLLEGDYSSSRVLINFTLHLLRD